MSNGISQDNKIEDKVIRDLLALENSSKKLKPWESKYEIKHAGGDHVKIGDDAAHRTTVNPLRTANNSADNKPNSNPATLPPVDLMKLELQNGLKLSFGEIVALAGDFYGNPAKPICLGKDEKERKNNFEDAYKKLADEKTDPTAILALFKEEHNSAELATKAGQPHQDYTVSNLRYFIHRRQILSLGIVNLDHFGNEASAAYRTGHQWAMEIAVSAASETDETKRNLLLHKAYSIEAFACHYLTDKFSAGHIRVPRRELFDFYRQNAWVAADARSGIEAERQHDEDGKQGLWVDGIIDGQPERWLLVGDGHLSDNTEDAKKTRKAAAQAVEAGIAEVTASYFAAVKAIQNGESNLSSAVVISQMDRYYPREVCELNPPPLFKFEGGELQERCNFAPGTKPASGHKDATKYGYKPFQLALSSTSSHSKNDEAKPLNSTTASGATTTATPPKPMAAIAGASLSAALSPAAAVPTASSSPSTTPTVTATLIPR